MLAEVAGLLELDPHPLKMSVTAHRSAMLFFFIENPPVRMFYAE
jgi:hypothetical protein